MDLTIASMTENLH